MTISGETEAKYRHLRDRLQAYSSLTVAFPCGVDSTFLLACAHEALGDRNDPVFESETKNF